MPAGVKVLCEGEGPNVTGEEPLHFLTRTYEFNTMDMMGMAERHGVIVRRLHAGASEPGSFKVMNFALPWPYAHAAR